MKTSNAFIIAITAALVASWSVFAEPPAKWHNAGKGGPGHGRMSDDFRGVIHSLFAEHEKVERSVELTDDGYRAKTTSKDPKVAAMLRKHVSQMESRLDGGLSVRHWDPAFVELRDHYDDMSITLEKIDDGIAVSVVGKTPEAIAVAQNHAKIISGFVKKGDEQMHATHAAVVAKNSVGDDVVSAGKPGSCEKCQGGKDGSKEKVSGSSSCGDAKCGKGDKPCCAARAGNPEAQTESE